MKQKYSFVDYFECPCIHIVVSQEYIIKTNMADTAEDAPSLFSSLLQAAKSVTQLGQANYKTKKEILEWILESFLMFYVRLRMVSATLQITIVSHQSLFTTHGQNPYYSSEREGGKMCTQAQLVLLS